jgi:hypothetical protein
MLADAWLKVGRWAAYPMPAAEAATATGSGETSAHGSHRWGQLIRSAASSPLSGLRSNALVAGKCCRHRQLECGAAFRVPMAIRSCEGSGYSVHAGVHSILAAAPGPCIRQDQTSDRIRRHT